MQVTGVGNAVRNVLIPTAGNIGVYVAAAQCELENVTILTALGSEGIYIHANGDRTRVHGCLVKDPGTNPIRIYAGGTDCVIVGNRFDGAAVDSDGSSIMTGNDETAF
jgi:hypothetical protein